MKDVKKNIEDYFGFLEEHIAAIKNINSANFNDLYMKLLFMSFIDKLSSMVYPNKYPHDRIVSTLKRFSKWSHGNNVSLPHLLSLLNKTPDPEFEKLRLFVKSSYSSWSAGEVVTLDRDLNYNDVKKLWPKTKEYQILLRNVSIDSLTHFHLFYTYRNNLIHDLKTPTTDYDRKYDVEPFYMHVSELDGEGEIINESWVLNYPVKFLSVIANAILSNIKKYLLDNELNPYDLFVIGNNWIEDLNSK